VEVLLLFFVADGVPVTVISGGLALQGLRACRGGWGGGENFSPGCGLL